MKTMVVIPDAHYTDEKRFKEGGVDRKAEGCVLQAIELIKPDVVTIIGDLGEFDSVSPWKTARGKRPPLEILIDDLLIETDAIKEGLDRIDKACKVGGVKRKEYIEGNHELWVERMLEENKHLRREFTVPKLMNLGDRGWKYHRYGKYVPFGKLHLYHGGHYTGVAHARNHVLNLSASVMYGHTHDAISYKLQKLGGYHGAWSVGCICKLEKAFLRGRPTNWQHGFAVVHFEPGKNGKFHVNFVDIIDGKCVVWGKVLKG